MSPLPVTTSRFVAALAAIVTATATYFAAVYAEDQALAAFIGAIGVAIAGALIPAAAAPIGTVDALPGVRQERQEQEGPAPVVVSDSVVAPEPTPAPPAPPRRPTTTRTKPKPKPPVRQPHEGHEGR